MAGVLGSMAYGRLGGVLPDEFQAIFWQGVGQDGTTFLMAGTLAISSLGGCFHLLDGCLFI
jgi:hypothetical protein